MICNSLSCRKDLSLEASYVVQFRRGFRLTFLENSAVVTTCSHIFCVECANALFSTPQICPACETSLPDSEDAVQSSLNPPDAYKTSVLSGLTPTLILDIASRALNFYTYQMSQESAFQALITKNAQERIAVLEAQCNNIVREATSEINLLKEKNDAVEHELELSRRKTHDLQETHKANAKAYTKLKAQYDEVRQRALLAPVVGGMKQPHHQASPSGTQNRPPPTLPSPSQQQSFSTTFGAGAPVVGGPIPLSNHSAQRPRRSVQQSHKKPSDSQAGNLSNYWRGGGNPQQAQQHRRSGGGGGGVAAMPMGNHHGSASRPASAASATSASYSAGRMEYGTKAQGGQRAPMPFNLGQSGKKGHFRPSGFAN